ncbi:MAG: flagellar motor protein MotB [Clostridia bacterium]|nr:flagellar motor protein MotB [Clostridia bacterium]
MAKKGKPKVEKDNAERWLLTYADLMNLLLIFFIILFAMSQVNETKMQQLAQSLSKAFGMDGGGQVLPNSGVNSGVINLGGGIKPTITPPPSGNGNLNGQGKSEEQQMEEVLGDIKQTIKENGLSDKINVSIQERGIKISITAQYLFASGSADLDPKVVNNILDIGKLLKLLPANMIRVEGHTDTDPIRTSLYPSNWELSSARATNVLRLLVEKCGVDPKMISAVGYGEYHPDYPNSNEVNKAKNRRVDIVILKQDFAVGEAGGGNK